MDKYFSMAKEKFPPLSLIMAGPSAAGLVLYPANLGDSKNAVINYSLANRMMREGRYININGSVLAKKPFAPTPIVLPPYSVIAFR